MECVRNQKVDVDGTYRVRGKNECINHKKYKTVYLDLAESENWNNDNKSNNGQSTMTNTSSS